MSFFDHQGIPEALLRDPCTQENAQPRDGDDADDSVDHPDTVSSFAAMIDWQTENLDIDVPVANGAVSPFKKQAILITIGVGFEKQSKSVRTRHRFCPRLYRPLSDAQYSAGFDILIHGPGGTTYEEFIIPQLMEQLFPLFHSGRHISVLEIGPGLRSFPPERVASGCKYSVWV
ncbi:hypothetical protein TSTA_077820 [Talaromyces stipitatus ATCC 10500]|uniref:Uncharacterized protein n=1 Tax=Talaromyces stipitatus (strain ATCC 10500 / CBS 375.48 / QM 6759 / NRRL 1006) TaxID=441959 RepID=B8LWM6_TALSN|nr:uncharacterized protein TSTA_077820 [Talaromyces stipitatus ATCC 10500]EED24423.1 hypothetical protein TSTA_077820 [Talaromyces stipitatus ATCC 10500]